MKSSLQNEMFILDTRSTPFARLKPVSINNVSLAEGFWKQRMWINRTVTIPTQYELLQKTGRIDNFKRVSGDGSKSYQGYVFNDSDVYKWLEAASWSLIADQDESIVSMVDEVITSISKAQDRDGYLNTYFSLDKVRERWTNLAEKHELYCAGHLIQAAIAHHRVTRSNKLLDIAIRLANHIYNTFGPSQVEGTSGHPEIEMAMVELYRTTGESKYLKQAELFINRRGHGFLGGKEYLVDHLPFRQLNHLAGHAVRALYLCSGAIDLALETGETQLMTTLEGLWNNLVNQQIYITGGVGARYDCEAFGEPYELPNSRAYAETCAAIASVMWNWRMLQRDGNARYADLLEWTLYNAILPGVSLSGDGYFYVNPLKSDEMHRRMAWFDCACCPPNASRIIAMFPGILYSLSEEGIWVNLYASSRAEFDLPSGQYLALQQTTSYPWDGHIALQISGLDSTTTSGDLSKKSTKFSLFLRIPGWLDGEKASLKINDVPYKRRMHPGSYLEIKRTWHSGDRIDLELPMDVRIVESHPWVDENFGRIALIRGPIVYCFEGIDNPGVQFSNVLINPSSQLGIEFVPELLSGITRLHILGDIQKLDTSWDSALYRSFSGIQSRMDHKNIKLVSIPYFVWANREPGEMEVWHRYR